MQIAAGANPQALSIALSRALFRTAPAVVLADAAHAAGPETADGVPVLLVDTTGKSADIDAELGRLGTRSVVLGQGLAGKITLPRGVRVLPRPPAGNAAAQPGLAVLVDTTASPAVIALAQADARAAGAALIGVRGGDPRADPNAIAALSKAPPKRLVAVGASFGPQDRLSERLAVAETGVQLPGGGQVMFPYRRLVALYGNPSTPALGVLGQQPLPQAITRAKKLAAPYDPLSSVPVVPSFEIIATVASSGPGPDGDYSAESTVAQLQPWVQAASEAGLYVILDLQPGRASLLDQAKLYESLLLRPNVGLALDPEWKLGPGQLPLRQIGSVDSGEINSVIDWLADLTAAHHLPQKVLVLHQFRLSMIRDEAGLDLGRDEVSVLIHMDGQGTPSLKQQTWNAVTAAAPKGVFFGWKNFFAKDHPMETPAQTMAHRPAPLMISYQ